MKTIIWDYNGTILDDVGITLRIENQMLDKRGMKSNYSVDEYKDVFDTDMLKYYKWLGYTFENETFEDVCVEFNKYYDEYFNECSLNEGILDALKDSKEKGYTNIILSSCSHDKLVSQCKELGIDTYFEKIMGIDNLLGGSKVYVGKEWMESNHIDPNDCMYIGDTNADYNTASELGVTNIYLVSKGHQSYNRLKELHPNVFHSVKEIIL